MSSLTHSSTSTHARSGRFSLLSLLTSVVATRRQRLSLADLDDTILRDIGISRSDALRESQRPLWDVPTAWRK